MAVSENPHTRNPDLIIWGACVFQVPTDLLLYLRISTVSHIPAQGGDPTPDNSKAYDFHGPRVLCSWRKSFMPLMFQLPTQIPTSWGPDMNHEDLHYSKHNSYLHKEHQGAYN